MSELYLIYLFIVETKNVTEHQLRLFLAALRNRISKHNGVQKNSDYANAITVNRSQTNPFSFLVLVGQRSITSDTERRDIVRALLCVLLWAFFLSSVAKLLVLQLSPLVWSTKPVESSQSSVTSHSTHARSFQRRGNRLHWWVTWPDALSLLHRPLVSNPLVLCCRLHLPPAEPEACCQHFTLQISFPSVSRSSSSSVALRHPL